MGRREQLLTPREAYDLVFAQAGAMAAAARELGLTLRHIKPHGALYNQAARDPALADAVARAVRAVDSSLILFALADSELARAGLAAGLRVAREAYADRRYRADGTLVPRTQTDAVIDDPDQAAAQALRLAGEHKLTAIDGTELNVEADTICVHGDNLRAIEIVHRVREVLAKEGIDVEREGNDQ
jgi:5-oxoprolinase (ATP-hydrolysing) subunit A